MPRTPGSVSSERRLDPGYADQFPKQPYYFVGLDETPSFRERIHDIYSGNTDMMDAVADIDEYFNDRDFADRPEVRRFAGWVRRSIKNPRMADEITTEIINQGYVTALKRLGYRDAPLNVAFSRRFAEEHGACFADAFMFGPGGAARIAFADWLIEERLHGMYRPGKAPGPAFSQQMRKIWRESQHQTRQWPQACGRDGEFGLIDVSAEHGKLPDGAAGTA